MDCIACNLQTHAIICVSLIDNPKTGKAIGLLMFYEIHLKFLIPRQYLEKSNC